MLKKNTFFYLLALFCFLPACSSQLNTEYQKAHNGKVLVLPKQLNQKALSHQYVLENAQKPVVANYKPPITKGHSTL